MPGWTLAAGLVTETGIEPPGNDAFTVGWAWRLAAGQWWHWRAVPPHEDPLLDVMIPRIFHAQGVAAALGWSERSNSGTSAAALLASLAAEGRTVEPLAGYLGYSRDTDWWPAVMPSHPEVVAAHLLECLPLFVESTDGRFRALSTLVHGDGPVGAATANAIVLGLGHRLPAQRAVVLDAMITLTARGRLPVPELGRALGRLVRAGLVKLSRAVAALESAVSAGMHAEVWRILAGALPELLPDMGERPRAGLGGLLGVAVRAASLTGSVEDSLTGLTGEGARPEVPGLAAVVERGGTSAVVREARRLQRLVAG
ncbi:DUF7825 domain-containing protein [Planomonospora algeriensis]